MFQFTLDETRQMAKGYRIVPVCYEMLSDIRTPMEVLRIFEKCQSPLLYAGKRGGTGELGTLHVSGL